MDADYYTPQLADTMTEAVVKGNIESSRHGYHLEVDTVTMRRGDDDEIDEKKMVELDSNNEKKEENNYEGRRTAIEEPDVDIAVMRSKVIRRMDILKAVFDSMMGKDRIAKICKYVIDLLRIFVSRSEYVRNLSGINTHVELFSQRTVFDVVKDPRMFLQVFVGRVSKLFNEKGILVSNQLGFYRQIMRCGGTPFRLYNWYNKILRTLKDASSSPSLLTKSLVWMNIWFTEQSLGEFIDLYYGVMDELMLLYKLKLWSNKSMHKWVGKHEALSWYYDILLGLKKNWVKLQVINQREFELKIQCQVRQRALELSAKLNSTVQRPQPESYSDSIKENLFECFKQDNIDLQNELIAKLKEFAYEKKIVKLDLSRLFFDFLADTTDVFSMKTPPGTYGALSLCSGTLGFSKLWIQAKKDLSNKI